MSPIEGWVYVVPVAIEALDFVDISCMLFVQYCTLDAMKIVKIVFVEVVTGWLKNGTI